jgi:hypothetical protein
VLYTPTDAATKYQAKAFIDMFLMRLAKGVGALLILAWIVWMSPHGWGVAQLGMVSLPVIACWLIVARAAANRFDTWTEEGKMRDAPRSKGVESAGAMAARPRRVEGWSLVEAGAGGNPVKGGGANR